jgi:hypothetical protein
MSKAMPRAICPGPCPGSRPRGGAKSLREHARSRGEGQLGCKIYSRLRWTRQLASGPWTCPPAPRRLRAARRLVVTRRRCLRASAARRMCSGACAPLRAGHIRAAPRCLRAPRLGACAKLSKILWNSCLNYV